MATDSIQLTGAAPSAVNFVYYSTAEQPYNTLTPAFEAWSDANYAHYLVAAAQQGTSNRWTAARPAGVGVPFKVVARKSVDGTPANDSPLGAGSQYVPEAAPATSGGLATCDASNAVNAKLTAAAYQTIAREIYGVSGTVWHVATAGNDTTGDGLTWATAYATLGKACSVASAGDCILFGGTVSQTSAATIPVGVSLRGADPSTAILNASNGSGYLVASSHCRVSGFRLNTSITNSGDCLDSTFEDLTFDAGPIDCIILAGGGTKHRVTVRNVRCPATNAGDGFVFAYGVDPSSVARVERSFFRSLNRPVYADSGTVFVRDSYLEGNSSTGTVVAGAYGGMTASVIVADSTIRSNSTGADVSQSGGAAALAINCSGSGTDGALTTSGTVTTAGKDRVAKVKAKTDLIATNNGDSPNTQTMQGLVATLSTEDAQTLADAAALLARTDPLTLLNAINTKTTNLPADPASNTQVNTRLAASAYTAPPTDYQQRGTAVTLPTGGVALAATQPNYAPAKPSDVTAALATNGLTASWASDVDAQATSAATNALVAATKSTAIQADYQQRGQTVRATDTNGAALATLAGQTTLIGQTAPANIAGAVLDAPATNHATAGTIGFKIGTGGGGGTTINDSETITETYELISP